MFLALGLPWHGKRIGAGAAGALPKRQEFVRARWTSAALVLAVSNGPPRGSVLRPFVYSSVLLRSFSGDGKEVGNDVSVGSGFCGRS